MNSNLNRALEWTTPDIQPFIMEVLSLLALIFFSAATWPKLKILMYGKAADRTNRIFERVGVTLKIAFGQTKLFQEKGAGWMHALIFWRELLVLINLASLLPKMLPKWIISETRKRWRRHITMK